MYMCNFACKGHSRNDLYCVGRDVKPYLLTHSLTHWLLKSLRHTIHTRGYLVVVVIAVLSGQFTTIKRADDCALLVLCCCTDMW